MSSRHKGKQVSAGGTTAPVWRDLRKMHRFATDLLAEHEIGGDWSVFWVYSFDNNRHGGAATHGHAKRIVFSAAQVAMLTSPVRRDVVRHEIAHAIVGVAAGHSDVWKQKAAELGCLGTEEHGVDPSLYPWRGTCPDGHDFVSVDPPGAAGFLCEDEDHGKPVPVDQYKKNLESRVFDPGVKKMAATYPEPESVPEFQVGDTVYVIPFGSDELDNVPLIVLEVLKRDYLTQSIVTGDEYQVRHEMVQADPEPDAEPE